MRNDNELLLRNNNYIKKIIKNNILHNDYYETLRKWYKKAKGDEKDYIIRQVFDAYEESFGAYYSIYIIMNAIEEVLQNHDEYTTVDEALEDEDFDIPYYR